MHFQGNHVLHRLILLLGKLEDVVNIVKVTRNLKGTTLLPLRRLLPRPLLHHWHWLHLLQLLDKGGWRRDI